MATGHDMEALAAADLDRAHEGLYFAAKQFVVVTEQAMVADAAMLCAEHNPGAVNTGTPAHMLTDAAMRYAEAYAQWETHLPDVPPSKPDEQS